MLRRDVMFWGLLLIILLHAVFAHAAEEGAVWTFKGYGTLGAVYHNAAEVEYRRDISQPATGTKAGKASLAQDSMLAVQADYRATDSVSGIVQVVSRLDAENSFAPQLSMLNLRYRAGDGHLHVGRLLVETYLEGDAAEIGYANTLVRQPIVHYPRVIDGLDADLVQSLGAGLLRFQMQAGNSVGKLVSNGPIYDTQGAEVAGVGMDYSMGNWKVRATTGYWRFKQQTGQLQSGGVFAQLLPSLPNGAQLYRKFSMEGRKISNRMLGLMYDADGASFQSGYSAYRSAWWPEQHNVYLHGGVRTGDFTPYAGFVRRWAAREFVGTGIADGAFAGADVLNAGISNGEAALLANQSQFSLGVRYDFMRNRALKLQWDRIRFQDSQILIDSSIAGSSANGRGFKTMNLYSIALDFVF